MSHYAVIREAGPGWGDGGIANQRALAEHATFMNALAGQGLVLFAGPLAGAEQGRLRVLLIVNSDSEAEIHRCLAHDPWTTSGQLQITSIEPWNLLVGADRLAATNAAPDSAA
jgi:uncharacterized protein YciI